MATGSLSAAHSFSSTSHTLLERVKRRDPEAWRRFVILYGPIVYHWSLRHGLQAHDASDIAQEVFQVVAEQIDRFERRNANDSLRGWLWGVTRNKIRDHYRRKQHEPVAAGSAVDDAAAPEIASEDDGLALQPLTTELAHRALQLIQNEFESNTWQAFWATAVEGRPVKDVAADLNTTVAAVYKAKSRVTLRLRLELDGLLD